MPVTLSKTKYLAGLQCSKLLWTHYNAKELIPEPDEATQARFDQGHEVGNLAKRLYPGGVEIPWHQDPGKCIQQTQALLPQRKPLFEAGFSAAGVYVRADILQPAPGGKWDLIEVKSASEVKDINCHDLAVQRYCCEQAGVPVRRCFLMHINSEYVRHGAIDPAGLLVAKDITPAVQDASAGLHQRIAEMQAVIAQKSCPQVDIGPHCSDPFECPLKDTCWAKVQQEPNNIFTLYKCPKKRQWQLYRLGIVRNDQLPADFPLSGAQRIQLQAERRGQPYADASAIRRFLQSLAAPLYFLDFESFMTAIPLVDGTRPFQQVPFQFSLHVAPSLDATPQHHSWLWDGRGHPQQLMLQHLKPLIVKQGAIVVYNAEFEKRLLREAAEAFPEHTPWVTALLTRLVDLLDPFRSFSLYHPAQHGSCSLKAVLPAWTGQSYAELAISEGAMAALEFLRVTFTPVSAAEQARVRDNLATYCGLDTQALLDLLRVLTRLAA